MVCLPVVGALCFKLLGFTHERGNLLIDVVQILLLALPLQICLMHLLIACLHLMHGVHLGPADRHHTNHSRLQMPPCRNGETHPKDIAVGQMDARSTSSHSCCIDHSRWSQ